MNYCSIKYTDIANGEGVRVSLFVSGCSHHCKGCFNPETWSFSAGSLFDSSVENQLIAGLKKPYINGLTLLGGDPFEIENQRALLPFVRRVRKDCPEKTIWAYTGCIYEKDLFPGGRYYCEVTDELLDALSVLVDGPFMEQYKDISLRFRGSSNQRLIDMTEKRLPF